MKDLIEKQEKFDKLVSELDSDILVCGPPVAIKIQDSFLYKPGETLPIIKDERYKLGTFNNKTIIVDATITWGDLRIFNDLKVELINLSNFGFDSTDMVF